MKKHLLVGFFVLALMTCLAVGPAQAQDTGKISIFGGYSYQINNLGANLVQPNVEWHFGCFFSNNCIPRSDGTAWIRASCNL